MNNPHGLDASDRQIKDFIVKEVCKTIKPKARGVAQLHLPKQPKRHRVVRRDDLSLLYS